MKEIQTLTSLTIRKPNAAYAAFTKGLIRKWTCVMSVIPDFKELLKPLGEVIRFKVFPALPGQTPLSNTKRNLLVMPAHLGGLGITNPAKCTNAVFHHGSSKRISAPLASLILQQSSTSSTECKIS